MNDGLLSRLETAEDERNYYKMRLAEAEKKVIISSALISSQGIRLMEADDVAARLAEADALLWEARKEVEWWTPDEYTADDHETVRLVYWYRLRDRIDAFRAGGKS